MTGVRRRGRGRIATARGTSIATMLRMQILVAPVFSFLAAGPAFAAADIELGRYLSRECVTCHRAAAATETIPNIFGMAEQAFAEVIKAYRDKRLDNAVMQNIAERLKDDEIEALAAYFAKIKRP